MLRIKGQWVERAGIAPGDRVEVRNPEPGVLLLIRLPLAEGGARYDVDPP